MPVKTSHFISAHPSRCRSDQLLYSLTYSIHGLWQREQQKDDRILFTRSRTTLEPSLSDQITLFCVISIYRYVYTNESQEPNIRETAETRHCIFIYSNENRNMDVHNDFGWLCTYSVSQKKIPLRGPDIFNFFHKRLRIFNRFFTHLLRIPIYARL